jgi:hypothetical protein
MADTPFGLSFGNPNKYMGSSGIGDALKTGLTAYALQQSGAVDWLNKQGITKNEHGKWNYTPTGSVPPVGATGADMDVATSGDYGGPVMPFSDVAQPVVPNSMATTQPAPTLTTPPTNIGSDILDGKYHGEEHSSVNPQAQRDFNPFVPQTGYNQQLLTGNEYQKVPGYGRIKQAAQMMMGMG